MMQPMRAPAPTVRSLRIGHRRFVLAQGANTIGRDPGSTVCVNDASVSRVHA